MRLPVEQVVDMQEIEARYAPELERALELHPAERLAEGPDLGRGEEPGMRYLPEHAADHGFRITVHRRGIDHRAAALEEGRKHRYQGARSRAVRRHVERDPAPHAHRRKRFSGRRNRSRDRRAGLSLGKSRPRGQSRQREQAQGVATAEARAGGHVRSAEAWWKKFWP